MAIELDDIEFFEDDFDNDGADEAMESLTPSRRVDEGDAFVFSSAEEEEKKDGIGSVFLKSVLPAVLTLVIGLLIGSIFSAPAAVEEQTATVEKPEVTLVTTKPVLDQVKDIKDSEIEMTQRQLALSKTEVFENEIWAINDANFAAVNVINPFIDRLIQLTWDAPVADLEIARDDLLAYSDRNSMIETEDLDKLLMGHGIEGTLKQEVEIIGKPIVSSIYYEPSVNVDKDKNLANVSVVGRAYLACVPVATNDATHLGIYTFTMDSGYVITSVKYIGCTASVSDSSATDFAMSISSAFDKISAEKAVVDAVNAANEAAANAAAANASNNASHLSQTENQQTDSNNAEIDPSKVSENAPQLDVESDVQTDETTATDETQMTDTSSDAETQDVETLQPIETVDGG